MLKWTVKKRLTTHTDDNNLVCDNQVRRIKSRRSMGDALNSNNNNNRMTNKRRKSLGNQISLNDKENKLTPIRRVTNRQSSTPLNDSSNLHKACKRKHHVTSSPLMSPISLAAKEIFTNFKEPQSVAIFQSLNYAPTLPSFDIEYSPLHFNSNHNPIMKNNNNNNNINDISLTSNDELMIPPKRIKFDTLNMSYEFKPESASTSSPLSTPLTARKKIIFNEPENISSVSEESSPSLQSLNSSEVGDTTLQKMIDDILASARTGKKFKKCFPQSNNNKNTHQQQRDKNSNFVKPLSVVCESNMEQKSIEQLLSASKIAQAAERTLIIADSRNEREVRSPVKAATMIEIDDIKTDDTCHLKRQNAVRRKNTSNENKNRKKLNESQKTDKESNQDSTIQKCLSFSSANYEDISVKLKTSSSVASNSSTSSSSYVSQSKFTKNLLMKGSLEMATMCDENKRKISIHVKKCKNLQRTSEDTRVNAYVKCALVNANALCSQYIYQRTAVHKNSSYPLFDHNFTFEIKDFTDYAKFVQIAVWHRNRHLKRSEFLGCLMISVKNIVERNIHGSFLLQPQICLTNPSPLIPEAEDRMLNYL